MKRGFIVLALCAALGGTVRAYEVTASDFVTGVMLDLRTDAVRESLDGATVFPFAYNNDSSWPAGGHAVEASVSASLTIERMEGAGDDPSEWTSAGDAESVPFAYGEARYVWAPDAAKYRVKLVQRRYSDETAYTAYYDLSSAAPVRASLSEASVALTGAEPVYDGTAKTPDLAVTLGGEMLTAGTDYVTAWYNNVSLGTAWAYVYGIGGYGDMVAFPFKIATECVASSDRNVPVADFRPGVLTNASFRVTPPLAFNDDPAWSAGGLGTAGRTARVSVAPLSGGVAGDWRTIGEDAGEGDFRWRGCSLGAWRARIEFCDGGEPVSAQTLERDFFFLSCPRLVLFVR